MSNGYNEFPPLFRKVVLTLLAGGTFQSYYQAFKPLVSDEEIKVESFHNASTKLPPAGVTVIEGMPVEGKQGEERVLQKAVVK